MPEAHDAIDLLATLAVQREDLSIHAAVAVLVVVNLASPESSEGSSDSFEAETGAPPIKVAHAVSMDAPEDTSSLVLAVWSAAVREVMELPHGKVALLMPDAPARASPEPLRSMPMSPLSRRAEDDSSVTGRTDAEGRLRCGTPDSPRLLETENLEGSMRNGRPKRFGPADGATNRPSSVSPPQPVCVSPVSLASSFALPRAVPERQRGSASRRPSTKGCGADMRCARQSGGPEAPLSEPWENNPRRKEATCLAAAGCIVSGGDNLSLSTPNFATHWFQAPGVRMGSPSLGGGGIGRTPPQPLSHLSPPPLPPARAIRKNRAGARRNAAQPGGGGVYESDSDGEAPRRMQIATALPSVALVDDHALPTVRWATGMQPLFTKANAQMRL